MFKPFSVLIFTFISVSAVSQITFDEGYYINNSGEKISVLIKYADWKNNPSEITFKTSANSNPQTHNLENVAGFGVDNEAQYVRATVPVDISNQDLKYLSKHGRFEFNEETVFLKTLVEGKADLFQYQSGGNEQFFFRSDEGEIEALIYKRYIPEFSVKIAENNQYQQQLYNALSCETFERRDFERTDYKKGDFVKFFIKYNSCQNSEFLNFTEVPGRDAFNLSLRPGVNFSTLSMNTYTVKRTMDFGTKASLRFGVEGEYIFPFFRDKWAFIVEPTYQSYKGEAVFPEANFEDGTVKASYQSLEIPFGVRHYFFLNENSRIFLNVNYTADFILGDSRFVFDTRADSYDDFEIETNTGTNFSFGSGFSYKKLSGEARYNFSRSLSGKKLSVGTSYDTFSLIMGYQLF